MATRARAAAATRTLARWCSAVIGSPRFSSALPPSAMTIACMRPQSPIVATMTALIVCIRFSAWSQTIERSDSKTSFVTSMPVEAEALEHLLADLRVAVVEGRQAVHELHRRIAGLRDEVRVDLVRA